MARILPEEAELELHCCEADTLNKINVCFFYERTGEQLHITVFRNTDIQYGRTVQFLDQYSHLPG